MLVEAHERKEDIFSDLCNRAQGKFTDRMWLEVGSGINVRPPRTPI